MISLEPIPAYLAKDFKYCREIARQREESLPIRFRFAPRLLRPYLHVVYAFMWTSYDFIHLTTQDDDVKLQLLDDWSRRLSLCATGLPDHPVFRAMAYVFEVTALPEVLLQNMLIAFRMDVTNKQYETIVDLKEYCQFAVNPLGRILLHLCNEVELTPGAPIEHKIRYADALCTAMKLTSFWQNLGRDARSGRPLYLPSTEMERFGVTEEMILRHRYTPMLGGLIVHLVEETRILLRYSAPLIDLVEWPLSLELAAAMERGMLMLDFIESCGGNTVNMRLSLTHRERLSCLWRAFWRVSEQR